MMSAVSRPKISEAEYLVMEHASTEKHEFLNGEIFAMAGASREHDRIVGNTFANLHGQLRQRDCSIFTSDMRLRIPAAGLYHSRWIGGQP